MEVSGGETTLRVRDLKNSGGGGKVKGALVISTAKRRLGGAGSEVVGWARTMEKASNCSPNSLILRANASLERACL